MRWLLPGLLFLSAGCASAQSPVVLADGEGVVRVRCVVQDDGRFLDCRILSEQPRGLGFGERALGAARQARLDAAMTRSLPPGAEIEYNIRFRSEDAAPALDLARPRA